MNERIRELVKQAGGKFSTHNLMSNPVQHREYIELWDKNIEKFALLIILECVNEVMTYQLHNNPTREMVPFIVEDIKLHFGVEE